MLTRRPWDEIPGEPLAGRARQVGRAIRLQGAVIAHPDTETAAREGARLRDQLAQLGVDEVSCQPVGWTGVTRVPQGWPAVAPDRPATTILLGNLSSNPEIATLYHAGLCPVDASVPGPGGYYVRSFQDVSGDGCDLVVVGVSTDADLAAAVDVLLDAVSASTGPGQPEPELPRLHRVRLATELVAAHPVFDPGHQIYETFRAAAQQAYRTRKHRGYTPYLSHLAEMFNLTASPAFAQLYLDIMQDMIIDTAAWQPDQWGRWGFDADFQAARVISSWHAIADSGVFTDTDRSRIAGHLVAFLGNSEEQWYSHRDGPYPARQNHYTFASLGLLVGAQLLGQVHRLPQQRRWLDMADECFTPALTTTKGCEDCDAYRWHALSHILRYAVLRPVPDYFTGTASPSVCAQVLDRGIQVMDNLGGQVPYGDASQHTGGFSELPFWQPATWLLNDADYAALVEKKLAARPNRQAQVTGMESLLFHYDLPRPAPEAVPDERGVIVAALDGPSVQNNAATDPPPARGFDKIAFRDSFAGSEPYLLLDGVDNASHGHRDAGAILRFTSRDRIWLEDAEYDKVSANFHNTVIVARDGQVGRRPPYAELGVVDQGTFPTGQSILRGYSGADWTRTVTWIRGAGFLVIDEVIAEAPGDYQVSVLWRTVGRTRLADNTWTITMGEEQLAIHALADGSPPEPARERRELTEDYLPSRTTWPEYRYAEPSETVLADTVTATLARGERIRHVHLLADSGEPSGLGFTDHGQVRGFVGSYGFELNPDSPWEAAAADADLSIRSVMPMTSTSSSGAGIQADPIWTVPVGDGPVAVLDDHRSGDPLVVAGDGARARIWQHGVQQGEVTTPASITALGAGPEGGFIAGQSEGRVAAFSSTGDQLWQRRFPAHMGHPAEVNAVASAHLAGRASEPAVLIATESCHVHAYTATGEEMWRYEVIHAANGVAAADLDGDGRDEVLAISGYWSWHIIDPDGSQRAVVRGQEGSGGQQVIGFAGLAVFGGWDGHVTGYRPDGEQAWDLATGDIVTRLLLDGEDLLVLTRIGRIYRVAADGTIRWWRSLPSVDLAVTDSGPVLAVGSELVRLAPDGRDLSRVAFPSQLRELWSVQPERSGGVELIVRDSHGQLYGIAAG